MHTWPFCNLFLPCAGFEHNMAEWLALLDQLEIPDGAVTGLNAADKPVLKGKLLQLPAADRPLFFDGPPLDVLRTLRTLLPDAPPGQAQLLLHHENQLACTRQQELGRVLSIVEHTPTGGDALWSPGLIHRVVYSTARSVCVLHCCAPKWLNAASVSCLHIQT